MIDINSNILRFRQQERADTLANFNARNEVLAVGELACVTDENKIKVGDGVTPFQDLNFVTTDVAESVAPNIEVDTISAATSDTVSVPDTLKLGKDSNEAGYELLLKAGGQNQNVNPVHSISFFNNDTSVTPSIQAQIRTIPVFSGGHGLRMLFGISSGVDPIEDLIHLGFSSSLGYFTEFNHSAVFNDGISFDGGVNTLDHYEEGIFTPQYAFIDTPTYTNQTGQYTRIGNILHFRLIIEVSNIDNTDTSNVHISGLPYNASPLRVINASLNTSESDILSGYFANKESIYFDVINSVSAILLQDKEGQYIKYTDISNSGKISITGWYFV